MKSNIVLIRGVQGSGKSTLASLYKNQGYEHLEADMFHVVDGVYKWDPTRLGAAHLWCQDTAEKYMVEGKNIVVSNTFIKRKEMEPYLVHARKHGYVVQEIICRGRFQNVHGVPEDKVEQKLKAFEL